MKMELSLKEVEKILSTLSTEEIENRLDYNWEIWSINLVNDTFNLFKKTKE